MAGEPIRVAFLPVFRPHIRPGKAQGAFAAVGQGMAHRLTGIIFCPIFVGRLGPKRVPD